jgi:predicted TPR repeat methyltransferase
MKPYRVQFPITDSEHLDQDEVTFYLHEDGERHEFRFHDYAEIYNRPGLYEQLFYERLRCQSPAKVASILDSAVRQSGEQSTTLRVLDFGAGNGIMGEELRRIGVARLLGVDIIPAAAEACLRDRPALYDDYYVADFTDLDLETSEALRAWDLDCLSTVAALGFGDIPPEAFVTAFNLIRPDGWVAFNIKQTFFDQSETTEFSKMIRELVFTDYLEIHHLERYRHRLSVDGEPLFYYAIAGKKTADVPPDLVIGGD